MQRQWAKWAFEGRTHGVAEGDDRKPQTIKMKDWDATVSFRLWQFGDARVWLDKVKVHAGRYRATQWRRLDRANRRQRIYRRRPARTL
jgi:hypothetical protein